MLPQFNQRVHMAVNSQHGNNKSNSNSITSTPAYRCSGVQVRASILSPPMSNNNNKNACRTVRSSKPTTLWDGNIAESSRVCISRERWDGQQTRHVACKHTGQMLTFGEFAFCLWTTETRRRLRQKLGAEQGESKAADSDARSDYNVAVVKHGIQSILHALVKQAGVNTEASQATGKAEKWVVVLSGTHGKIRSSVHSENTQGTQGKWNAQQRCA